MYINTHTYPYAALTRIYAQLQVVRPTMHVHIIDIGRIVSGAHEAVGAGGIFISARIRLSFFQSGTIGHSGTASW